MQSLETDTEGRPGAGLPLTLTALDLKSGADWLVSEPPAVRDAFLNSLTKGELLALPFLFDFWAMPHQVPPEGDWRTWVILGGRGAGKPAQGPNGCARRSRDQPLLTVACAGAWRWWVKPSNRSAM